MALGGRLHADEPKPRHRDIRWSYRYRDITSFSKEGAMVIDYTVFHEIIPE